MCGAGTILIERAYSGRYRYLLGGDISTEAIHAAETNIGKKHRPRQLFHWDAQSLPLADWSADKIVCSPPFAKKHDDKFVDRTLYQQFLIECERVLKPTGRMVLLTTHHFALENLLKQRRSFQIVQRLKISLLGQNPWAYLCIPY
jgi:tRNA G10  N-methylase Trm11